MFNGAIDRVELNENTRNFSLAVCHSLSLHLSVCLCVCVSLPVCLSVCVWVCLYVCLYVCVFFLFMCVSVCIYVCVCVFVCLSLNLSACLSVCLCLYAIAFGEMYLFQRSCTDTGCRFVRIPASDVTSELQHVRNGHFN